MQFKGTNRNAKLHSEAEWKAWCRQTRRRPQLRTFAELLTRLIEQRVGSPRPHVADVVDQAMRDAGRSNLTDAQLREVIVILCKVWNHGLGLRNWAHRSTSLLRDTD
jgi:cytochrome P450